MDRFNLRTTSQSVLYDRHATGEALLVSLQQVDRRETLGISVGVRDTRLHEQFGDVFVALFERPPHRPASILTADEGDGWIVLQPQSELLDLVGRDELPHLRGVLRVLPRVVDGVNVLLLLRCRFGAVDVILLPLCLPLQVSGTLGCLLRIVERLEVLLLILLVGIGAVEIFELRKVLLTLQDVGKARWVLSRAEPAAWHVADPVGRVLHPSSGLLRDVGDLVDADLAVLGTEHLVEEAFVDLDTWLDLISMELVQQRPLHHGGRCSLTILWIS
mmetsp:Transcript_10201/g.28001  ORF Transcript_10201/g.28001 Transcript_10201/m.28001 type:complete len:274 (+) Transcript_10201:691-1512(+)